MEIIKVWPCVTSEAFYMPGRRVNENALSWLICCHFSAFWPRPSKLKKTRIGRSTRNSFEQASKRLNHTRILRKMATPLIVAVTEGRYGFTFSDLCSARRRLSQRSKLTKPAAKCRSCTASVILWSPGYTEQPSCRSLAGIIQYRTNYHRARAVLSITLLQWTFRNRLPLQFFNKPGQEIASYTWLITCTGLLGKCVLLHCPKSSFTWLQLISSYLFF